jgi:hypothetical protein
MQLGPRAVPRAFIRAQASSSSATEMPKARLAPSVPASDWNMRSIGQPSSSAFICTVTCDSTQCCVGTPFRSHQVASSARRISAVLSAVSVAGLMPMTASPQP